MPIESMPIEPMQSMPTTDQSIIDVARPKPKDPIFVDSELDFIHVLRDKMLFIPGTFESMSLGNGVALIWAKTIADPMGPPQNHAIIFQKGNWTADDARVWLSSHKDAFTKTYAEIKEQSELYSIPGVEVFASGKWNGDEYTNEDLDNMVLAFEATKSRFKPFLKLGHDDNQKIIQEDGLPAAGWIDKIYRKGNKLYADFIDIPKKIYQLILNKAYRKVSAEIWWNVELQGKFFPKILSAVSLLGTDHPAVDSLNDILSMFSKNATIGNIKTYKESGKKAVIKTYDYLRKDKMEKTENEIKMELALKENEAKLEKLSKKLEEMSESAKESEQTIVDLKKYKEELEKVKEEQAAQLKKADLKNQLAELEKENLIVPSMNELVEQLLDSDKKEYTVKGEKSTRFQVVKNILKLFSEGSVNLTLDTKPGLIKDNSEDALNEQINKYAEEHKVSIKEAYKAVLGKQK